MTEPYYQDDAVTLYYGDCLDVLRTLPDASVDSVVTDPPYELTANKKGGSGAASVNLSSPYGRARIGTGNGSGGFMGKAWDATGIAFDPAVWRECLRVLKPGGHLLAFGGSRTWHRLACAIEDAGFELRDSIAWLYGSGFPKSLDVSKAIDKAAGALQHEGRGFTVAGRTDKNLPNPVVKGYVPPPPATPAAERWQGWGTALKPAFEPVVVARKPLEGTVAANVLAWGTGALNIDATRVATADSLGGGSMSGSVKFAHEGWNRPWMDDAAMVAAHAERKRASVEHAEGLGRWPANVVLDEHAAAELDRQSGTLTSGKQLPTHKRSKQRMGGSGIYGASAAPEADPLTETYGDQGGASRFFYVAKAPTSERPRVNGIAHPTVKPLDLMRWLVRLVTPPGGTVLEPFAGSGTTAEACVLEGFQCVAIEREADYLPLIVSRLDKPVQLGLDFEEPD